ncbi:hypothetical protein C7212DRAFT_364656 [Tuber magnatum]|uniref:Uncharacterized protein n=1 Tax=Tuber magnatum TaxID=42249 RepID=A0A317SPQ0_9PEZI|nr:hypothetical protein C7212DRAFT_364656 [Tuber magnatum]
MDDIDELLNIHSQPQGSEQPRRTPVIRTSHQRSISRQHPYQRTTAPSLLGQSSHQLPSSLTLTPPTPSIHNTVGNLIIHEPPRHLSPSGQQTLSQNSQPHCELLEKILQNQDRLEKKFDKQQRDLEVLRHFIQPSLEIRQGLRTEKPFGFPTQKTFVDSPNLLSRDVEIFNALKILQGQIQSIHASIQKHDEKLTKDEGEMFCRRGLRTMTPATFTTKKAAVLHNLSEAISEEKSKFKSRLIDSTFRQLPITAFAQHLFTPSMFTGHTEEKITELQAVAAKWRHITSHDFNPNPAKNVWWSKIFRKLSSLFQDVVDNDFMRIHLPILEEDQNLYQPSPEELQSHNGSNLEFPPSEDSDHLQLMEEGHESYSTLLRDEGTDMGQLEDQTDDIFSDLG